ncbi:MAG TPA: beta-L-arabinofuranosidase domain-containing protein [Terracidiphilus sp.]
MNRRNFVKLAALVPWTFPGARLSAGAEVDNPTGRDREESAPGSGPVRARFDQTLRRVLDGDSPAYTEEFVLADVRPTPERRFTEYSGDVSGRYIGALATASQVFGTDVPGLASLVEKVIALQKPEGYFGSAFAFDHPADRDMALLWGNGRLLVGLLEYHALRPTEPVLASCRRLGDFLVRISPLMLSQPIRDAFGAKHFASSYICWTQQTEGLASLYRVTKGERYRTLAEEIAAVIERRPGDHVHGYLTSLRGVMDLYAVTGQAGLLQQCEAAWQDICGSQDLLITGGVPEGWSPNNHRTEGCGEADWVRLNLALWKATTNQKYLALAERALFNELAFNQFASGDFGHRVYTETGLPAGGAVRAWWCCTLHGLRCFPDIEKSVFRASEGGLYYDLPLDGQIKGTGVEATAESNLARDGSLRITIHEMGNDPSLVALRRPAWAKRVDLRLNGKAVQFRESDGYAHLERHWRAGDIVDVRYAIELRETRYDDKRVAFSFGPWLLGASVADNPAYFNELTSENRLLGGASPAGAETLEVAVFSVPVAATTFRYAQAEYPDQPGHVQLRAIAEQTGQPTTSWELRFLTESSA